MLYGPGYTRGIIPFMGLRYRPIVPIYAYTGGFCGVCGLPSYTWCDVCGYYLCKQHAYLDPHLFARVATEADAVGSNASGEEEEEEEDVACPFATRGDFMVVYTAKEGESEQGECCFVCGQPDPAFHCSRCHSVLYCSGGCQQHHWDVWHSKTCATLTLCHEASIATSSSTAST
jgi:hypothetical protein